MRRHRLLTATFPAVVAMAGALGAACGGSSASPATRPPETATSRALDISVPAGQPMSIGVSAPLTGDQRAVGTDIADAAALATTDYGGTLRGHPLRIVRKDDGCSDPEKAAAVAQSLTDESNIAGVVGPVCTTGAQAADRIYEDAGVVHVSPAVTRAELSAQGERYLFRTAWRDDAQARVQSTYARGTLTAATAVVIDDGEPYGKSLADTFVATFESAGGRTLAHERVSAVTADFTSLATRLAAMNPDVIAFEGVNPGAALLVKELRKAQFAGAFIAPDGAFSVRDFLGSAADAADGSVITAGAVPDDAFTARFRDRTGRSPSTAFVLQTHDGVTALLRAMDAVATSRPDGSLIIDRSALADALHSRTFSGLTGTIRFDANGDRTGDSPAEVGIRIYRVRNNRFEVLP